MFIDSDYIINKPKYNRKITVIPYRNVRSSAAVLWIGVDSPKSDQALIEEPILCRNPF